MAFGKQFVWYVLLIAILQCSGVESKCDPLFMCPSFCMKFYQGCYICECGTFSGYMQKASENMARVINGQQAQTGTQFSSYNTASGNDKSFTQNAFAPGFLDYKAMLNYELGGNFQQTGYGNPISNTQVGSHYSALNGVNTPNLANYGSSYENVLGIQCPPVEQLCPRSCLVNNVFAGCVRCACTQLLSEPSPSASPAGTNMQAALSFPNAKTEHTTKASAAEKTSNVQHSTATFQDVVKLATESHATNTNNTPHVAHTATTIQHVVHTSSNIPQLAITTTMKPQAAHIAPITLQVTHTTTIKSPAAKTATVLPLVPTKSHNTKNIIAIITSHGINQEHNFLDIRNTSNISKSSGDEADYPLHNKLTTNQRAIGSDFKIPSRATTTSRSVH